jgi:predicted N-acetyltransferase YhbS
MDNKVKIRPMEKEDLSQVAGVFVESFNQEGEHWTYEVALDHVSSNFFGDSHFVAILDGKVIGFIMAFPLIFEQGVSLFVDAIAVYSHFQKQGIGQLLWDRMSVQAKDKEYKGIRLLTNPQLKSFDWYKKMGYKESGWLEVYKTIEE